MSRRWRYPRSRRGTFYGPPQSLPVQAAPSYVPAFQEPSGRNARLVGMRSRRGRFSTITRVVCPPPHRSRRSVVRLASARRGKFFDGPRVGAAPAVAPWMPAPLDPARRATVRPTRRGNFYVVPLVGAAAVAAPWIPPALSPTRRAVARPARRGRHYAVPQIGATQAAAPWVPPALDPARRQLGRTGRRGVFFAIPLLGAVTTPPVAVPQLVRSRLRLAMTRRGRFWATPPRQASSWVPPVTRPRRPPVRPTRRGDYLLVPVARVTCPARIPSRRPRLAYCARSQMLWTPLAFAPVDSYSPLIDPVVSMHANTAGATPRANLAIATTRPNTAAAAIRPNQTEAT
jgi:hypothetical protein